jgi:hypothetical protein
MPVVLRIVHLSAALRSVSQKWLLLAGRLNATHNIDQVTPTLSMVYGWVDPDHPASRDKICYPDGAVRIALNQELVNVFAVVRRLDKL